MNEKQVLMKCHHPFIQRLYATYKDQCSLYMLIQFVQGGELFNLLWNSGGRLSNESAIFYAACVVSVLSYLHKKSIIYRDLKPENLMIDKNGYIMFVDFGFAKEIQGKTSTLCGTPEYIAPEVVVGKSYNKSVDYWSLGILIYEILNGYSPFCDKHENREVKICRNIVRGKFTFSKYCHDVYAKDIIKRFLEIDPSKRLGCIKSGDEEIKSHPWFRSIFYIIYRFKLVIFRKKRN